MDRRLVLAASVAVVAACSGSESPPAERWALRGAADARDSVMSVAVDGAGDVLVGGYSQGQCGYGIAYFEKRDAAGARVWRRQVGPGSSDAVASIACDRDGSVVVAGYSHPLGGTSSAFAAKTTGNGARVWTAALATVGAAHGAASDAEGNAYVAGWIDGALEGEVSLGAIDAFVRKYSPDGATLWTRQLGTAGNDEALAVATDARGDLFVVGLTDGSFERPPHCCDVDIFVAKYDGAGAPLWTRQLGTASDDVGFSAAVDAQGNVFVGGYTSGALGGYPTGNFDAVLVKLDPAGATLWIAQLGSWAEDYGLSVAAAPDGGVLLAGRADWSLLGWSVPSGNADAFVARYSADGALLWLEQFGTSEFDIANGVAADTAGNVFVGGYTRSPMALLPPERHEDGFVASFSADGSRR